MNYKDFFGEVETDNLTVFKKMDFREIVFRLVVD